MSGSTNVSSVHAVDYRSPVMNMVNIAKAYDSASPAVKTTPQTGAHALLENPLAEFRNNLQPAMNINAQIQVQSQIQNGRKTSGIHIENELREGRVGALAGLQDNIRKMARDILRPESAKSVMEPRGSHSRLMDTLKEVRLDATSDIRQTLLAYAKALMESTEPPVGFVEPIKILWRESSKVGQPDVPDNIHIDMLA